MNQPHNSNTQALADRVDRMINIGRLGAARPLVAALRRMGLADSRMQLLEAKLALREGRLPDALDFLDQAVERDRANPILRRYRAEARLKADDQIGAAADAAEAVILDGADPVSKALLGVVLIELGHYDDARACLLEAIAADPRNASYRVGLSESLVRIGEFAQAEATLDATVADHPHRADLRSKAILLRLRQHHFQAAIDLAQAAGSAGIADPGIFGLMGHAYSSLGRHDLAAEAYREALKLCPEDPYVRHLVAASGAMPGADRAPPDYLRAVFNGYADRFEPHIIGLRYRVPGLIRKLVAAELEKLDHPALLDLGCGTGLIGATCHDLALGALTGIDISPAMLEKAREKQVYHELIEADLPAFLESDARLWSLATAGDVFCYFGDLGRILTLMRQRMAVGGLLIFSVEELLESGEDSAHGQDHRLGRLGRYCHSEAHIREAAATAGFAVATLSHEALRLEADIPVAGIMVALRADLHG